MSYAVGSSTPVSTGVKTWTIGFQAARVRFVATIGAGSSTTTYRKSECVSDGVTTICDSETIDNTNHVYQQRFNDRMLSISEWNGSAFVETFRVNFDSITPTEVKYNVVTLTNNFQIRREAEA